MSAHVVSIWDRSLRRAFQCAGRTVTVFLAALRAETGEPRFEVIWMPDKPERLTVLDITHFVRMRRQCERDLIAELENPL